jgi:hypothetical protein
VGWRILTVGFFKVSCDHHQDWATPKPTCFPKQGGISQEDEARIEQTSGMALTFPNGGLCVTKTKIPAEKIRAYEATDYRLGHSNDDIILNVGKYEPRLLELFREKGVICGAFLTAYNPQGTQQSDAANDLVHAKLAQDLTDLGVCTIEGSGSEEGTDWPSERSYFALGLSIELASKLGTQYRQDAVVWVGANAIPELLLLR